MSKIRQRLAWLRDLRYRLAYCDSLLTGCCYMHEVHDLHCTLNRIRDNLNLFSVSERMYNVYVRVLDTQVVAGARDLVMKHGGALDVVGELFGIDVSDFVGFTCERVETNVCVGNHPELDPEYNPVVDIGGTFVRKMYPVVKGTLDEYVNGAKIYVYAGSSWLVLYGRFDYDPLRVYCRRLRAYRRLVKQHSRRDMGVVELLSYRDFIVSTYDELDSMVQNMVREAGVYEKKSLGDLHRAFAGAPVYKQRKIVGLLLATGCVVNARALMESLIRDEARHLIIASLGSVGLQLAGAVEAGGAVGAGGAGGAVGAGGAFGSAGAFGAFESSLDNVSVEARIAALAVGDDVKAKAFDKLREAQSGRESGSKAQHWIDGLLRVPFGVYRREEAFSGALDVERKREFLKRSKQVLDSCVHGHEQAKLHIERLVAQWTSGSESGGGSVFGFVGPPGTGKTTLAKNGFAKCLVDADGSERPLVFLPIGGSSGGSLLEGHGYTYMGSTWGRVVDSLMTAQCMNPVFYVDELDKISDGPGGREIIGILTHLTDPSQNSEFCDRYFSGVTFDMSRAIFIFSYNDRSKVDRVLLDRICEIETSALSDVDKLEVVRRFLLPEICGAVGLGANDIVFDDAVVRHVVNMYTCEAGVRKLKERLYDIVRDVNLTWLRGERSLPFCVDVEYIDTLFNERPQVRFAKVGADDAVGVVNGLYASAVGVGGLTMIEVAFACGASGDKDLVLTGSQGDVMKESMMCARTLACNLAGGEPRAFHVHCPEAATAKDGPSAGAAITLAMVSRLRGVPVKRDVAMTGEIDLSGRVRAIGGLEAKLFGALRAGVSLVLVPEENRRDLELWRRRYPEAADDIKVTCVGHIDEVLDSTLVV